MSESAPTIDEAGTAGLPTTPFVERRASFDDARKDWDDATKATYASETNLCWRCGHQLAVVGRLPNAVVRCDSGCEDRNYPGETGRARGRCRAARRCA
jgi:hypothetical protein